MSRMKVPEFQKTLHSKTGFAIIIIIG
ncbi:Hypothetical protein EIN_277610, partial [Entamoeba invadens IP1]